MIHTFSLIHDDLPGMDDDDLRRGRPTNHKVFGEGMAILAGDALLSLAFETLSRSNLNRGTNPCELLETVCTATGPEGMIGGQAMDLHFEGRKVPLRSIYAMHRRKTGALIHGSLRLGAQVGGASAARSVRSGIRERWDWPSDQRRPPQRAPPGRSSVRRSAPIVPAARRRFRDASEPGAPSARRRGSSARLRQSRPGSGATPRSSSP
jgi:hypothetical protein